MRKMFADFIGLAHLTDSHRRRAKPLPNPARIEGLETRLLLIATPSLVKDLFPGASSSNPARITAAGTVAFFVASPANNDEQLFVSDGTPGGTVQLTSITCGANPTNLTNVNGTLFSAVLTQTIIAGAASTIAITSSDNPGIVGDAIQFNAAVTSPAAGTPSGTVEFFDGATSLGTALLFPNGQISFATSSLAIGDHVITAQYQGDGVFAPSTSAPLTESIVVPTPANLAPSLAGAAGSIPPSVVGGAKLRKLIPISVSNQTGAAIKETITIALYATADANSITGGTMIGTLTKKVSLKPGKAIKLRIKAPAIPASLPNGTYNIVARLTDPANDTLLSAYPGTVQVAAPFISPTASLGAVTPTSIAPGKHGSVTLTVINIGNVNAKGALSIQISPSIDGQTAIAGQSLESISRQVNIKPAASVKIKLRLTIPATLAAGQYTPLASVTIQGNIATAAGLVFTVT